MTLPRARLVRCDFESGCEGPEGNATYWVLPGYGGWGPSMPHPGGCIIQGGELDGFMLNTATGQVELAPPRGTASELQRTAKVLERRRKAFRRKQESAWARRPSRAGVRVVVRVGRHVTVRTTTPELWQN